MISILLYVAAFLASTTEAQQAQLVYDQHFIETPPQPKHHNNPPQSGPSPRQIPLEFIQQAQYPNSPEYVPEQTNNAIHQHQHHDGSQFNQPQNHQPQFFDQQQKHEHFGQPHQQHFYQQPPQHQQTEDLALFAPIPSVNNNQIQPHTNQPQQQKHQHQQPLVQQGFMHHDGNMHHNHKNGIPINRNGFPFGLLPPNLPPGAIPVPIPASQFHHRRGGPINKMMKGVQRFAPRAGNTRRRNGGPVRMNEMNRLPKPPKYPLYDMPEVGMATPPPPPLMHPMSLTAMATSMYPSFALPGKRGKKSRRRPKQPPLTHKQSPGRKPHRSGKRRPPPHGQHTHTHTHKNPNHNPMMNQYEHTMASSIDPAVSSPPLGRPLNYDEYMQRPSHSFTDDPWNFDPQAQNYNSGMNTYAMKYNYDPLGMNSLDKEQAHLDPDSLSYPGDTHVMQDSSSAGSTSQIGGWDMKPETYRQKQQQQQPEASQDMPMTLKPPPVKASATPWNNHNNNNFGLQRNEPLNSFNINQYDQFPDATNTMLKSDSLNLDPLKILSDANPGIEFTVESSSNGAGVGTSYASNGINRNNNNNKYDNNNEYNNQDYNNDPDNQFTWNQYPQKSNLIYNFDPENIPSVADNDPAMSVPRTPEYLEQMRSASKYENGVYDTKTKMHTMALAQDYVPRDKPASDYTDNYNPYASSGLSTGLMPPSETAAMFKRQGAPVTSRTTRGDKIPLVELEGLSLLNDILKSKQTSGTRKQLYSILTM